MAYPKSFIGELLNLNKIKSVQLVCVRVNIFMLSNGLILLMMPYHISYEIAKSGKLSSKKFIMLHRSTTKLNTKYHLVIPLLILNFSLESSLHIRNYLNVPGDFLRIPACPHQGSGHYCQ